MEGRGLCGVFFVIDLACSTVCTYLFCLGVDFRLSVVVLFALYGARTGGGGAIIIETQDRYDEQASERRMAGS